MPPQLLALTEGPSLLLDKPIILVGRHQECDILIASRKISRRHCCIAQVNDHLVVRDLCSTNGIRINGVRVAEGNLKGGDELTIGNYRYEVRLNAQAGDPVAGTGQANKEKKPEIRQGIRVAPDNPFESWDQPVPLKDLSDLPLVPGEGPIPKAPGVAPPDKNLPGLLLPENISGIDLPPPQ